MDIWDESVLGKDITSARASGGRGWWGSPGCWTEVRKEESGRGGSKHGTDYVGSVRSFRGL